MLHQLFARSAATWPDQVAVEVPPSSRRPRRERTTYAELAARVWALESRLRPFVVGESVIAIRIARDTWRLYAAQLATLGAGAAYTCIDVDFPDDHARRILADSGAVCVLTDAGGRAAAEALIGVPGRVVVIDDEAMEAPERSEPEPDAPERLAYLIYTSGTTGQPKGVMIEHRSILNLVDSDRRAFGLRPGDRVVQGSSPAYDSSVEETWLAFASGATLLVMDAETARLGPDLAAWLREERATVFCPPPTLLRAMACADPERLLPDLALLYVGGEALTRDVADLWARGRRMVNGYGPTECTVTSLRADVRPGEPITIGRAVDGLSTLVVDADLRPVPAGAAGELLIGGVALARGYLNRPELTGERFPEVAGFGRAYRTGDLVRQRTDGDHEYLGRIDSQVKVRGHRIELEAVEAALAAQAGVVEAGARLQGEGSEAILVAFLVPRDAGRPPATLDILEALRRTLPESMVPARLAFITKLPRTAGGKLDRRALPPIAPPVPVEGGTSCRSLDPREARIAAAFAQALGIPDTFAVDADFFVDLGGDSLRAALLVSILRTHEETAALAVRDLYEARTVAALARRRPAAAAGPAMPPPKERRGGRPVLMTAAQTLLLVVELVLASAAAAALLFHLLLPAVAVLGPLGTLLAVPAAFLVGGLAWGPIALAAAVLAKKVLIGRYEAGRHPAFGGFHLRHWMMGQVLRWLPVGLIQGTPFLNVVLRRLGARIGRGVHLHRGVDLLRGGWDLLDIEDGVTLGQEAALQLVDLEDGELVVRPIRLGRGATLETRAAVGGGAEVGADASLAPLAYLGAGRRLEPGRRQLGITAADPTIDDPPEFPASDRDGWAAGSMLVLGRLVVRGLVAGFGLAVSALAAHKAFGTTAADLEVWLADPTIDAALGVALLWLAALDGLAELAARALLIRLLGRPEPGSLPIASLAFVRVQLQTELLDGAGLLLSGTTFWPRWLRLAGMRVGRDVEVSTIIDVVPALVEIGAGSFLADGIYLGGARLARGRAELGRTRLGQGSFVGNHAVIPAGVDLPEGVLIGVSTVADPARVRPGSSWFGHPPMELPRREIVGVDRRLTYEPGPIRRLTRFFWEALRFFLPAGPALVLLAAYRQLAVHEAATDSMLATPFLAAPLAAAAVGGVLVAAILAMKWLLLGRVRPGQHPLWSCWCSRWDFHYVAWAQWARPTLAWFEGTLLLPFYLRAMGSRIGRRCLLGAGFAHVVDPDMLAIEDDATVDGTFQAHSFEDRVLKIDRLRIGRGAGLGRDALLFYGAELGEQTRVAAHAVVMKHEKLLAHQSYEGAPTRPVPEAGAAWAPESEPLRPVPADREPFLDAARGTALVGMILVHLVPGEGGEGFLGSLLAGLVRFLEGKSAALFCLVAGWTVALQARRSDSTARFAIHLLRRAAALYVAGLLMAATIWETEVLRPMALLVTFTGLAARCGKKGILGAALFSMASIPVLSTWLGTQATTDWIDGTRHVGLLTMDAAGLRYLFFDGNYPVAAWLLFPLAGAALSRLDRCHTPRAAWGFLIVLAVFAVVETHALRLADGESDGDGLFAGFPVTWTPTSPAFLLMAGSGALLPALAAWLWQGIAPRSGRGAGLLRALGRTTLSHYVLHLVSAYALLKALHPDEDWSVTEGASAFAAYLALAAPLSLLWLRRHRRGPLEALLSRLAGPSRRAAVD